MMSRRPNGWVGPVDVPDDLTAMRGPASGKVRLPLSIYSSGAGPNTVFDLDDPAGREEFYEIVLTNGTATDICRYLNLDELLRLWDPLWLPRYIRTAWEPRLQLLRTSA